MENVEAQRDWVNMQALANAMARNQAMHNMPQATLMTRGEPTQPNHGFPIPPMAMMGGGSFMFVPEMQ